MNFKEKKDLETQRIEVSSEKEPENPFLKIDSTLLEKLKLVAERVGKTSFEFVEDWIMSLPDPDRKNFSKILKSSAETIADLPAYSGSIEVFCVSCQTSSKITKLFANQTIPCPNCRKLVKVPPA